MSEIYFVHCVDTEGPMNETLQATFQRVKALFGIELTPTVENLHKLQQERIDLGGVESAVSNLVRPERISMNRDWCDLEKMLDDIGSERYRSSYLDSNGQPWVFNWFCLDHVGYTGENPRGRDVGNHKVFDRYRGYMTRQGWERDGLHWHYHPLPYNGNLHSSGLAYLNSQNIWSILSRKIIERRWFPSAYRPGFHAERPDSHWFLEQWIPFDFANQSLGPGEIDTDQPDLADGRWGDWRRAPNDWRVYNPSHDDYQVEGNCRRWIARCLNIDARLRVLSDSELGRAFLRARSGLPTLVAFTNHDFRDMRGEIDSLRSRIKYFQLRFPEVKINFCEASSAMRAVLGLAAEEPGLRVEFEPDSNRSSAKLKVQCLGECFGTQPYLAVKTIRDEFIWENFDTVGSKQWSTVFDENHIPFSAIHKIGVAVNSPSGITELFVIDREGGIESHEIHH